MTDRRWARVFLAASLCVVLLPACAEDEPRQHETLDTRTGEHVGRTETGEVKEERELTGAEIDTLRAWQKRLKLTRDEYWDEHGGVVANEWGEVWYAPGKTTVTHAMAAFIHLQDARRRAANVFPRYPRERIKAQCAISMEIYTEISGMPWWLYSRIDGNEMIVQPIPVLFQRGLIDIALAHEYYRWTIQRLSAQKAPAWIEHGLASVLSGEIGVLQDQLREFPTHPVAQSLDATEEGLRTNKDKEAFRVAAYNACRSVGALVAEYGRERVGEMVVALGNGGTLDSSARDHLGASWDEVRSTALSWQKGWAR